MNRIPDASVDMILCDLPYGTTACKWDTVIPYDKLWNQYNRIIKKNGAIVLFGSEPFSSALRMSNIKNYKYDWVWNKKLAGNAILAKKQPLKIHENVIVFNTNVYNPIMTIGKPRKKMSERLNTNDAETLHNSKTKCNEYENDTYYPVSIQEFTVANMRGNRLHPTQKPVDLLEYLIKTYTTEGEVVVDNCMGSGSTAVASINAHRNFIGFELESTYYEVAKNRINKHITDSNMQDIYTETA